MHVRGRGLTMYDWLHRRIGPRWAAVLTTLIYLALILLCIVAWRGESVFRYGHI